MSDRLDEFLYDALKQEETPSPTLNRQIISKARLEEKRMKNRKRSFAAAAAVLCVTLAGGGTAYAAFHYLTSSQIADHVAENESLAKAFESKDAISIQETQQSGEYSFCLLGLVSGSNLEPYVEADVREKISDRKTYATLAVSRKDGADMPDRNFCVSPLIGGVPFEKANNGTMGTMMIWFEQDGVIYERVECDDLEIFADRGVWLSVVESFGDEAKAFTMNGKDGSYSENPDFAGIHALFQIPFDESKADPAAAEQYLKDLDTKADLDREKNALDADSHAIEQFKQSIEAMSRQEIENSFDDIEGHSVTATPDADGYIELTWLDDESIPCGISGQIASLIGEDQQVALGDVFESDQNDGFSVIFRNADGSFTYKEFEKNEINNQ